MTRHRSNVAGWRAQCINEVYRTLEGSNIKLSSVASDITGVSATDMKRFGSASRAAAWSGMGPGNRESGGRRYRARRRFGNKHLKSALVEAGRAAGRSKDTCLGA